MNIRASYFRDAEVAALARSSQAPHLEIGNAVTVAVHVSAKTPLVTLRRIAHDLATATRARYGNGVTVRVTFRYDT